MPKDQRKRTFNEDGAACLLVLSEEEAFLDFLEVNLAEKREETAASASSSKILSKL